MQVMTIEAATPLSAQGLYSALAAFHPELVTDDEGRCYVSVQLGNDRRAAEVLDTLHEHLRSRAEDASVSSVTVALDEGQRR